MNPIRRDNLRRLPGAYWWVVAVGAVFTLARFSEAFLVLRAAEGGLPLAWTPLVMVGMNLVYALAAYPFGKLSDRMSHGRLLAFGLVLLIAADLTLAASNHWGWVWAGISLWGLHMARHAGPARDDGGRHAHRPSFAARRTACSTSSAASPCSSPAAWRALLWDGLGARATFLGGAAFSALALAALLLRARLAPR